MDKNRMRLGLMYIFKESSSISKQAKLQLVNFIENATEHQLKALALDGEFISSDVLDEDAKDMLDARFDSSDVVKESLKKASVLSIKELSKKAKK